MWSTSLSLITRNKNWNTETENKTANCIGVVYNGLAWRYIWYFEHSCKPEKLFKKSIKIVYYQRESMEW